MWLTLEGLIERDICLGGRDARHTQNTVEDCLHKVVIINAVELQHRIVCTCDKVALHNLRNMLDFWFLDYTQYDVDKLLDEYFDEELGLVKWGKFDTLAHLTYPLRYIIGEQKKPVDMARYTDKIDEILRLLAQSGKALEINTSGLRQPLGTTMPDEYFVRRFREFGGELITVGSDAHYAEHLGANIEDGMALAKKCGFDYIALFNDRLPTFIPIE